MGCPRMVEGRRGMQACRHGAGGVQEGVLVARRWGSRRGGAAARRHAGMQGRRQVAGGCAGGS